MRVIWYEVRKVFNWKILLLLALLALIMYQLFISFYFKHFPNGNPESDDYKLGVSLVKQYGPVMDVGEFNQFKLSYDTDVTVADKYIQSRKEFAAVGIRNYEDFKNIGPGSTDQARNLMNKVMLDDQVGLFYKLQEEGYWVDRYEHQSSWTPYGDNMKAEAAVPGRVERIHDIITSEGRMSILPWFVFYNYTNLIEMMAVLIFFGIIVLTGPIYFRDRRNRMIHVQYTTQTGRRLLRRKTMAALVSSLLLVTVELSVFFVLYSFNHTSIFFASSVNSFINDQLLWFNLSFFQFIVLTVVALYVFAILITLAVVWISSISRNTLALIGMQVLTAFLAARYLRYYLIADIADIRFAQFVQPLAYLLIIVAVVAITVFRGRRELRMDIA